MVMNNVAILKFLYNYIYKNGGNIYRGVSNRIPVPNTDCLPLLPTP